MWYAVCAFWVVTWVGQAMRTHESQNKTVDPDTMIREDLPPCPCTIYEGFCSKTDLSRDGNWGVACVSSEDALVTMPWQVQCVPAKNGGMKYRCPRLLPVKCNPEAAPSPCDTSALADCTADDCGRGMMLIQRARRPKHCGLQECTAGECCNRCTCAAGSTSVCCQGKEAKEDFGGAAALSCPGKIKALATPTTLRLSLFAHKCAFGQTDVYYGSKQFALTAVGKKKICSGQCQAVEDLAGAPHDVYADALVVSEECPDEVALKAQVGPVGIFAAAAVLDQTWRDCASGLVDTSSAGRSKVGK